MGLFSPSVLSLLFVFRRLCSDGKVVALDRAAVVARLGRRFWWLVVVAVVAADGFKRVLIGRRWLVRSFVRLVALLSGLRSGGRRE